MIRNDENLSIVQRYERVWCVLLQSCSCCKNNNRKYRGMFENALWQISVVCSNDSPRLEKFHGSKGLVNFDFNTDSHGRIILSDLVSLRTRRRRPHGWKMDLQNNWTERRQHIWNVAVQKSKSYYIVFESNGFGPGEVIDYLKFTNKTINVYLRKIKHKCVQL